MRLDPTETFAGTVDEVDPQPQNEDSKGQSQRRTGQLVRQVDTKPCPNEHRGGQDQRCGDVYIAMPVVLYSAAVRPMGGRSTARLVPVALWRVKPTQ
jgi:hypothetical protein